MSYEELARAARGNIGPFCKACPVCDGRACAGVMPGPGDKGVGRVAHGNWEAWQNLRVNMDTLHGSFSADTRATVLGCELSVPVMIGPVGDVQRHYGERYDTVTYNRCVLEAAAGEGTLAWTGDGLDASIMTEACDLIASLGGRGVPTVKPWDAATLDAKLDQALDASPAAVAMDIDAAGLPFLRGQEPPAGAKSAAEVAEVVSRCHERNVPFVLKGVMTPRAAARAAEAGVDAIVVSNHGGRVLDGTPATAEALPDIVSAVGDEVEVLVDGGIRSGLDVFRAIALGARACLVCRPFVVSAFGGGERGVRDYLGQLRSELADAMEMCGTPSLRDISRESLWAPRGDR